MDVEQVNALMFAAEGKEEHAAYGDVGWHRFLDEVLADEFKIRRSTGSTATRGPERVPRGDT